MKFENQNEKIFYLSKMMQDSIKSPKDCTKNRIPNLGVHEIHLTSHISTLKVESERCRWCFEITHHYDWSPDSSNCTSIILDWFNYKFL